MQTIAIFGGTFDPVHNGHLAISENLEHFFKFDRYIFLPCKIPVIKTPSFASSIQRVDMLKLALANFKQFQIDKREIMRDGPSYMVDTLESFRLEFPKASLSLVLGADAFAQLPHWYQWEKIIRLAHIIVLNRSDLNQYTELNLKKMLQSHLTTNKKTILQTLFGKIFLYDAGNFSISSTLIRKNLQLRKSCSGLLPDKVIQYIIDEGLYQ